MGSAHYAGLDLPIFWTRLRQRPIPYSSPAQSSSVRLCLLQNGKHKAPIKPWAAQGPWAGLAPDVLDIRTAQPSQQNVPTY